jgi:hypothetical protein
MASRSASSIPALARAWFPLALLAVLVLALPGLMLFALKVLNRDQGVNRWLGEHFHLTYDVAVPWWAGLLLLLLPLLVILLYFLKLKRKPLQVPSTFLWKKSIEDLHVNSLFQWLRENVLLLLQLLILLALVYSLLSFRVVGSRGAGKHYIILIDNSASMAARDVAPTRLDWARQEALKVIDAAGDDDLGMVIAFNSNAEILQLYTEDRDLLRQAVRRVGQTQRQTRLDEALSLAASLANRPRSTEESAPQSGESAEENKGSVQAERILAQIHLFSDGRFPEPDFALGNLSVEYHLAGRPGADNVNNVAIVTCSARRDDDDPSRARVLVGLRNYRPDKAHVKVELTVQVAGRPDDLYEQPPTGKPPLELEARQIVQEKAKEPGQEGAVAQDNPGEGSVTFELGGLDDQGQAVLHARLLHDGDDFPLDDEAWLVLGAVRKARVLLVGPENRFLDAFFNGVSIGRVATVTRLTPPELKDAQKYRIPAVDQAAYDLVIFDRCGPDAEQDMPSANTFFIGYPPPPWKPASAGAVKPPAIKVEKVEYPHIKGWAGKHALLRHVSALYEVGIGEAFKMPDLPAHTPRLIESDREMPLLLSLNRQTYTDLVLTFPIITEEREGNTNWPLHASFPLFLRNVLDTLGNVVEAGSGEPIRPGEVVTVRPDVAVKQVEVTDPGKTPHFLDSTRPRTDFAFTGSDRVGVYQVKWEGGQRPFAVNLLDPDESDLQPRDKLQIGGSEIAAGQTHPQFRDLWKWIAAAALVLLLAEWYIYNRRIYI